MNDIIIECLVCGKTKEVSFEECLHNGWANCCGFTMRIKETKANIEKCVKGAIKKGYTITVNH